MKKDYHDFRPILAEIEERPPNPLGTYLLWTIIAFMLALMLGIYFIKVDVVVAARGKIIPFGDVKILQPLETGILTGIHVKEGDYVRKGDILLEIDPSVDKADLEGKDRNLKFSQLAMDRVNAVLSGQDFSPSDRSYPREAVVAQLAQYRAQRDFYASTLQEKEKAINEIKSELKTLHDEIENIGNLVKHTSEDERRYKALVEIGALAENRYREKMRERMTLEREFDVKKGQVLQIEARLARIEDERETFKHSFKEKLLGEYSTNLHGKNVLEAEVSSLTFKKEKKFIASPVNGHIYLLPVKTLGAVLTTAQPVVGLVPENSSLIVNAVISNKDIGFVKEGQDCIVKVDTFDFQKYGTIMGKVKTISPFSLEEKENDKTETNQDQIGGYPVHLAMNSEELQTKDGNVYRIKPGMTVTAEISVGRRRVIEFFLFPVIKYLDEGLKVR